MKKLFTLFSLLILGASSIFAKITPGQMINIAGKQRMLSQKLAKVYLMKAYGANLPELDKELNIGKIIFERNMKTLSMNAPKMFSEDVRLAINQEIKTWYNFKVYLDKKVDDVYVSKILDLSNELLMDSDAVVEAIEKESSTSTSFQVSEEVLKTINVSGKQRMLSQRLCVYFIAKKLYLKRGALNENVEIYLNGVFTELDDTLVALLSSEINSNEIDEAIGSTLLAFEKIRAQKDNFLTGNASMNLVYNTTNELTNLYDGLTAKYSELAN